MRQKVVVVLKSKNLTSIAFKNLDNARIVTLFLADNKLTSLPVEIGRLTGLKKRSVARNRLTWLPVEIGRLPGLKDLDLRNNPLTTPPIEVCEKGTTAIRTYFLKHQAHSIPDEENPKAKTMQPAQQEGLVSSQEGLPSYDEAVLPAPDDDAPPSYDQLMMDENSRVGSM
jgi:Leucine-rich repeat (LRR) protein